MSPRQRSALPALVRTTGDAYRDPFATVVAWIQWPTMRPAPALAPAQAGRGMRRGRPEE